MNKTKFILNVVALSLFATSASAQVVGKRTATGNYGAVAGVLGTDITGTYWQTGNGAVNNGFGCLITTGGAGGLPWLVIGGGNYSVIANWGNGCNTVGGGPMTDPTKNTTVLVSNRINEGAAGHAGQYSLATVAYNAGTARYNQDFITNGGAFGSCNAVAGNCAVAPIATPVPFLSTDPATGATYSRITGQGTVQVSMTFGAAGAASGRSGYFDVAPAALITGIEVFALLDQAAAPTTSTAASWTALAPSGATVCNATNCTGLFTVTCGVPPCTTAGRQAFVAARLVFDGGANALQRTSFLSGNSIAISGPTGTSGLPSRVEVFNQTTGRIPGVQVRWTTTNESTIAGFNILASRTSGGVYKQMNDSQISAAGSPNTYLQTISSRTFVTALGRAGTYYLKLVTVLKDGTTQSVGPTSFALPSPEPRDGTGKTGGRGN